MDTVKRMQVDAKAATMKQRSAKGAKGPWKARYGQSKVEPP